MFKKFKLYKGPPLDIPKKVEDDNPAAAEVFKEEKSDPDKK